MQRFLLLHETVKMFSSLSLIRVKKLKLFKLKEKIALIVALIMLKNA